MPSANAGGALQQRGIQGFDGGVRRKLDGGAKGWDDLSLAGDDELQWPQGTLAPAGAHYSPGLPQELRMLVPASAAPAKEKQETTPRRSANERCDGVISLVF